MAHGALSTAVYEWARFCASWDSYISMERHWPLLANCGNYILVTIIADIRHKGQEYKSLFTSVPGENFDKFSYEIEVLILLLSRA